MNDERLKTIGQVKQFLTGSEALDFGGVTVEERYQWIETALVRFKYYQLKRAEKGAIRRYIKKVSGYSRAQVPRLIRGYNQRGQLRKIQYQRHQFPRSYTTEDIALVNKTGDLPSVLVDHWTIGSCYCYHSSNLWFGDSNQELSTAS
ncbi:hypothetical protein ACFLTZ_05355 [Chloroflexota bacterium]